MFKKVFLGIFLLLALVIFTAEYAEVYPLNFLKDKTSKTYYVLKYPGFKPHPPGLFCVFACVLGFLEFYEQHPQAAIKVDFGYEGIYFEPSKGPNWWEYYFSSIHFGNKNHRKQVMVSDPQAAAFGYDFLFKPRHEGHRLIQKYIRIHADILTKIDHFVHENFTAPYILGIHYRGTDKSAEAPRVPYEKVYEEIEKVISALETDFLIFVATDEQEFLDDIQQVYPNQVISTTALRSQDGYPIHYGSGINSYQKGEEAVIDCLLLSRCHCIMRTISYLSTVASFFNPSIPLITLNKLYSQREG